MVGEIPLKDRRTLWASVTEVPNVGRVAVLRDISQFKALDEAKSEIITTFTYLHSRPGRSPGCCQGLC
jgi:hypothetical protein